ncbi:MAG: pyridoxal-phosphate dependent enzyme [Actinobacteria bacterium]|nr:pyridoxal-phosphate dependent enzyme [Actinomycetota bacterium]
MGCADRRRHRPLAVFLTLRNEPRLEQSLEFAGLHDGNTGIGLAVVCAIRGYSLILTMPEDMSVERRRLLARLGAEVRLTPAIEGMSGAVWAAEEIARATGAFMPRQFDNPANPEVHYRTTGPEILADTDGKVDAFVAGVGTGGTVSGVGRALREARGSAVRVVGVEPSRSPVLSGGRFRAHAIQGIGASFVPANLDRSLLDDIVTVADDDAMAMAGRLAREEGLLVGISAGANVHAAVALASTMPPESTVVTILCDTGERYLSVTFPEQR